MKTLARQSTMTSRQGSVVNDFNIHIATVNGSGSQSSNNVLMRSIFQMGVPVSGKNLFPSNIAGLPTWFTIRVNKNHYLARQDRVDVLVAMNPQTAVEDVKSLPPGSVCVSPVELKLDAVRNDVKHYQVPFSDLAAEATDQVKLRKLLTNMIYVGVVSQLLNIDEAEVERSIHRQFAGKQKVVDINLLAMTKGREWAKENIKKDDPFRIEKMNETGGKIIIDGNAACAIGCLFAGASVMTWYPITPSSSLCETVTDYLSRYRIDKKTGKATFAVIQAEDEMAAIGMALGAGWAGARSMTSTSGPGTSLMTEFVGYGYFAEIPVVIFDIQRVGPSTGLPTRTAQADLLHCHLLSHGDTKHIVLFPGTVEECYRLAMEAFDLAERFQTPVFVLSDLDLGMNNWMSDPFVYPDKALHRGKVLTKSDLEKIGEFARYKDVDGDGIPYRTLPGTKHHLAAYFTRGSGHNEQAAYTERPEEYEQIMRRLDRKFQTARAFVPEPVVDLDRLAKVGIIAFGSSHFAVEEARDQLAEVGIATSYLRVRALPFNQALGEFLNAHESIYVVEQNRDAQMRSLITLEEPGSSTKLKSVLHFNGLPIDAATIAESIAAGEKQRV